MKFKIYQVDAFADKVFQGNPAAVCPLSEWLSDDLLLKIAEENNLSDTAFYVFQKEGIEIRWFTPKAEVNLCGHATLAAALVLAQEEKFEGKVIPFYSKRSGALPVTVQKDSYTLNFPCDELKEIELTEALIKTSNFMPRAAYRGKSDVMLVFEDQQEVEQLLPQLDAIKKLDARGLIVTAQGKDCDFVSRFFAPAFGIDEDPVTGSAHTTLVPYWAKRLGKLEMEAVQVSARRGKLHCALVNDRVELTGKAVLYLKGEMYL